MNRILFVDDEPGILDGLRNALRRQRSRWDMAFVSSGTDALTQLERAPFDLVVTDMRMPQMDGAELLARVKAEHPATARIVLSGHADREAILRVLPVAHQYLTKPCDPETLCTVIERTCNLNGLLQQEPVRRVIGALNHLPSAPQAFLDLTEAMSRPNVEIAQVVAIVERDLAMSVKVLQLVNSAYFGLGRTVTSIRQAVSYLGLELLKGLTLSAHVFSTMEDAQLGGLCLDTLQEHSMRMARIVRRFIDDSKLTESAFTTALVHDVGEIVLALAFGKRYSAIGEQVKCEGVPCHVIEEKTLGVSHAEVGAYLLGMWGLPLPIVEAVAYHHHPGAVSAPSADCRLLAAVHVADVLTCAPCAEAARESLLDHNFLAHAGVADQIERWRSIAIEELQGA